MLRPQRTSDSHCARHKGQSAPTAARPETDCPCLAWRRIGSDCRPRRLYTFSLGSTPLPQRRKPGRCRPRTDLHGGTHRPRSTARCFRRTMLAVEPVVADARWQALRRSMGQTPRGTAPQAAACRGRRPAPRRAPPSGRRTPRRCRCSGTSATRPGRRRTGRPRPRPERTRRAARPVARNPPPTRPPTLLPPIAWAGRYQSRAPRVDRRGEAARPCLMRLPGLHPGINRV